MFRTTKIFVLLFLAALFFSSCKTESAKDLSLNPEEYRKLGLPGHTRIWSIQDYINSNITLSTLKSNFPYSLPRKSSKKSGAIFARLMDEKNLSFIYDKNIPLSTRAYTVQHFTRFYSELQSIYSVDVDDIGYYGDELADINIFGLLVHDRMLELAFVIMNSDVEEAKDLQFGMKTVKRNYLNLIDGLLDEQVKAEVYKEDDLNTLSDKITASVSKNISWFVQSDKDSVTSWVENAMAGCPTEHIRQNFKKMLKIIEDTSK
ncbi:MAG: hypothetical protein GYA41_06025 [Bacteroidales bacterium]|nr:hypothetical protein [Bacteroidales bacterium]